MKDTLKKTAYLGTITIGSLAHFTLQTSADIVAKAEGIILNKIDPSKTAKQFTKKRKEETIRLQTNMKKKIEQAKFNKYLSKAKLV